MDGADELLRLSVITQRLPRRFHPARQCRIRDDAAVPDLLEDFVLGDQPVARIDQQREQGEDLGLERHSLAPGAQLDPVEIEFEVAEPVQHPASIPPVARFARAPPP